MKKLILALVLLTSAPAFAQGPVPVAPYAAPDKELWDAFKGLVTDVACPAKAHGQLADYFRWVEREAQMRAVRASVPAAPPAETK